MGEPMAHALEGRSMSEHRELRASELAAFEVVDPARGLGMAIVTHGFMGSGGGSIPGLAVTRVEGDVLLASGAIRSALPPTVLERHVRDLGEPLKRFGARQREAAALGPHDELSWALVRLLSASVDT